MKKINIFTKHDVPFGVLSINSKDLMWSDSVLNKILKFSFNSELKFVDNANILIKTIESKSRQILVSIITNSISFVSQHNPSFDETLIKSGMKKLICIKSSRISKSINELYTVLLNNYRKEMYIKFPNEVAIFTTYMNYVDFVGDGDSLEKILKAFRKGTHNMLDIINECKQRYGNLSEIINPQELRVFNPETIIMNIQLKRGYFKNQFNVEESITTLNYELENYYITNTNPLHIEFVHPIGMYTCQLDVILKETYLAIFNKIPNEGNYLKLSFKNINQTVQDMFFDRVVRKFINEKFSKNPYLYDYVNVFSDDNNEYKFEIRDYELVSKISEYVNDVQQIAKNYSSNYNQPYKDPFFINLFDNFSNEIIQWSYILFNELDENSIMYTYNSFFNGRRVPLQFSDKTFESRFPISKQAIGLASLSVDKLLNFIFLNEMENYYNWNKKIILKDQYAIFSLHTSLNQHLESYLYIKNKVEQYNLSSVTNLNEKLLTIFSNNFDRIFFQNPTKSLSYEEYQMYLENLLEKNKVVYRLNYITKFFIV